MQRINHDQYQVGYRSELDQNVSHALTMLYMIMPVGEMTRLLMGNIAWDMEAEIPQLILALLSLGRGLVHANAHYGARTTADIIGDLECTSNYSNRTIRDTVCLFSSTEQIARTHRKTQLCAGAIIAALTLLCCMDASSLSRRQESFVSAFILTTIIVAGEVIANAVSHHFGADMIDVELHPQQQARPSI